MSRTNLLVIGIPLVLVLVLIAFVSTPHKQLAPPALSLPAAPGQILPGAPAATARMWPAQIVDALDFLPHNPVTDGSVDYTVPLQTAIDAAAGRMLLLPDFPVKVSKRAGQTYCLLVQRSVALLGCPGSVIRETQGAVQILRSQSADDVRFEGFAIQGKGGSGHALAHGILQITGGKDVVVERVTAIDSDADGIVVANASGVRVTDCRSIRSSKAGIYLSRCTGAVVSGCSAEDGQGHWTPEGNFAGAGFQLSSNTDLVCTGNIVRGGVGIGILCDSNDPHVKPFGCVIANNRIEGVSNATTPDISCGIRLANLADDTVTRTLVSGNSIEGCGTFGLYAENHGQSTIADNVITSSQRSGLVVGHVQGLVLSGNTIVNSDVSSFGGSASIYLINGASNVLVRGNVLRNDPSVTSAIAFVDASSGTGNSFEPNQRWASAPPAAGAALVGEIVWNCAPASGGSVGWICVQPGAPGTWAAFGKIE